jgi:hypothetical protein
MAILTKIEKRGGIKRRTLVSLLLILFLACGSAMAATPQQLTPQAGRISDGKIQKDRKTFEAMQARVRALNFAGVPLSNFHLAKAQAYLDVALDEYLENDRSSFVELALGEADGLLRGLEVGEKSISLTTYPLDAEKMDAEKTSKAARPAPRMPENRLRPDLWAHAESLKQNEHFSCAAAPTAQFEVQILQAIHDDRIGGWRRTSPYVAIAENLAARAQEALDDCVASAGVAPAPVAIAKEPAPVPAPPALVVATPPAVAVAPPSVTSAPLSPVEKPKPVIILSERCPGRSSGIDRQRDRPIPADCPRIWRCTPCRSKSSGRWQGRPRSARTESSCRAGSPTQ